jgi:hypothetical protein
MRAGTALLLFLLIAAAAPLRAQSPMGTTERAQPGAATPAEAPAAPAHNAPLTAAQQLAPAASLLFAQVAVTETAAPVVAQPAALSRRDGFGMMIGGGALFVAGLLVGGDAGTIMALAGGGVGAYGLYLYFR